MQIESNAAYASTVTVLSGRTQLLIGALRDNAEQQSAVIEALATGQRPAPTSGRGQIVDLSV